MDSSIAPKWCKALARRLRRLGAADRAPKTNCSVLKQIVSFVPPEIIHEIERNVKQRYKKFSVWSHIVALIYQQLTKTESLNGLCDAARVHGSEWGELRGASVPHRNTLSNANRKRDPKLAETLYWKLLGHFSRMFPDFTKTRYDGYLRRFRERHVHLIDSTTIQLVLNSIDWAWHRRRKAAAKVHMNLDLGSRLPSFAIVEDAAHHDSVRAAAATANLTDGDILVADRAYTDFVYLRSLAERGVLFVVRQKRNIKLDVVKTLPVAKTEADEDAEVEILKDELVKPARKASAEKYTADDGLIRRVTARVKVEGKLKEMIFFSNAFSWSPRTIAELYKARWGVETFFKEFKQTCQVRDFLGYNEKAVKWQIWIGLTVHLLLRFMKFVSHWTLSFSRLAGVVRCAIWVRRTVVSLLGLMGGKHGTASARKTMNPSEKPLVLQGYFDFGPQNMGQQALAS